MEKSLFLVCASLCINVFAQSKKAEAPEITSGQNAAGAVIEGLKSKLTEQMAINLVGSVTYCHEKAITLTKDFTISNPQVIEVKRTSLKIRNPKNIPDKMEEKVLHEWQKLADSGKPLPEFYLEKVSGDEVRFYKPLKIANLCLTCHGNPSGELLSVLKSKYPQDKALGYKEGELRGLIRVSLRPIHVGPSGNK
jgi:hypothetical protein